MRKHLLPAFILLTIQMCFAQKTTQKKADIYFDQYEYASAATAYEKALAEDSANYKLMAKLVTCYQKLNDSQKAETVLAKICKHDSIDIKYFKQYGDALAANNKYNAAIQWYNMYLKQKPDAEVSKLVSAYEKINLFYRDSSYYSIKSLTLNSKQSDFSPVFYHDGILFCSARNTNPNSAKFKWNNSAYIDLYFVNDIEAPPIAFDNAINSNLHEGPATLSSQHDTLFFTRNTNSRSNDGILKLKIYASILKNGKWQKAQNFQLNNNDYSTGHPALAPDHRLYFVSDMPGGLGGTDLYYTEFINHHWSAPVNLGPTINTSGNEMFPYVDRQGNLYFSSNMHASLGGLDVFLAKANGKEFQSPVNLGYPINSSKDDFGLIIRDNKGFFSSNRGSDPNDDNIFAFILDKTRRLNIQATSANGKPIDNFIVQLVENEKQQSSQYVETVFTNKFNAQNTYIITCTKEGYIKKSLTLTEDDFAKLKPDETITIQLERAIKNITINVISNNQRPVPKSNVQIKNLATGKVTSLETDINGKLSIEVSPQESYEIIGSKVNYKTKSINLSSMEIAIMKNDEQIALTLPLSTALFDKNEIGQIIELDIKYDVNKANIRKDAAKSLDKLIVFLKENPNVKVELGSHTDSRGSEDANLTLSQKRAASAALHIASKGIKSARIIPVGYGKNDLKIENATSEEEHQQNRRTTVKIVGL